MTEKEAWNMGSNMAKHAIEQVLAELQELEKPLTEKQKYMSWMGWNRELGFD